MSTREQRTELAASSGRRSPAYLRVSDAGLLLEAGGDLEHFGLEALSPAAGSVAEQIPYLEGLLPLREPVVRIPRLRWRDDAAIDLCAVHEGGSNLLLFLDAAASHSQEQRYQQAHNALALRLEARERQERSLEGVLESLSLVILEPTPGPGLTVVSDRVPAWYADLWAEGAAESPLERFEFLAHFLEDAKVHWSQPKGEPALRSGSWVETNRHGAEVALEAIALDTPTGKHLAIERLGAEYSERREQLQVARQNRLLFERLEQEVQRKEVLIHCIVHDLAGPLTAIRGCLELLLEADLDPELERELTVNALDATHSQHALIQDILQAFRAENELDDGDERANLLNAISGVTRTLGPAFVRGGVQLVQRGAANVHVCGEETRLKRVLSNLLENALRYSPRGSTVSVVVEEAPGSYRVSIDDEGPGLDPQSAQHLFKKFSQGKSGRGKLGLGLYFCRMTVNRWGGDIGCEPRAERGTRFWFRLPRAD